MKKLVLLTLILSIFLGGYVSPSANAKGRQIEIGLHNHCVPVTWGFELLDKSCHVTYRETGLGENESSATIADLDTSNPDCYLDVLKEDFFGNYNAVKRYTFDQKSAKG